MIITALVIITLLENKILAFFLLGCANSLLAGHYYNYGLSFEEMQSSSFYRQSHLLEGEVISLVTPRKSSVKVNFRVDSLDGKSLTEPLFLRLTWLKDQEILPKQGEHWRMLAKFKPAHGFANPGGFNFQIWLREKSIHATGYIKSADYLFAPSSLRQAWYDKISEHLNTLRQESSLSTTSIATFLALTFGDRSQLSKEDWHIFKQTGTQHLIAISGLHLALVFGFALIIVKWLVYLFIHMLNILAVRVNWFDNYRHSVTHINLHKFSLLFALISAAFYAYLAGFSAPTMRALVMLCIYVISVCIGVNLSKIRLLILTIFVIFVIEPMSPLMLGFWLSVLAVSIIFAAMYFSNLGSFKLVNWKGNLVSLVLIQLALSCFMAPVLIWQNSEASTISGVVNLFAVPWVSLITLPLVLASFFLEIITTQLALDEVSNHVSLLALYSIEFFHSGLGLFVDINEQFIKPMMLVSRNDLAVFLSVLALLISIICIVRFFNNSQLHIGGKLYKVTQSLPVLLCLFIFSFGYQSVSANQQSSDAEWSVNVLDVGQGLSIVIERNNKVAIYDFGASYPSGFNIAESVIYPYLKSKGVRTVDLAIISHSDNDHFGGFDWLADKLPISKLIIPFEDKKIDWQTRFNNESVIDCSSQEMLNWQGLTFNFLHKKHNPVASVNDNSCVIRVSDRHQSILLTGDISKVVEKQLLDRANLKSDVLLAPHHGSKSSSTKAFLSAISPDVAIFSAGFMNRWQMPSREVLARYESADIRTYQTAKSGMITVKFSGIKMEVMQYREDNFPFWFANLPLTIGD